MAVPIASPPQPESQAPQPESQEPQSIPQVKEVLSRSASSSSSSVLKNQLKASLSRYIRSENLSGNDEDIVANYLGKNSDPQDQDAFVENVETEFVANGKRRLTRDQTIQLGVFTLLDAMPERRKIKVPSLTSLLDEDACYEGNHNAILNKYLGKKRPRGVDTQFKQRLAYISEMFDEPNNEKRACAVAAYLLVPEDSSEEEDEDEEEEDEEEYDSDETESDPETESESESEEEVEEKKKRRSHAKDTSTSSKHKKKSIKPSKSSKRVEKDQDSSSSDEEEGEEDEDQDVDYEANYKRKLSRAHSPVPKHHHKKASSSSSTASAAAELPLIPPTKSSNRHKSAASFDEQITALLKGKTRDKR